MSNKLAYGIKDYNSTTLSEQLFEDSVQVHVAGLIYMHSNYLTFLSRSGVEIHLDDQCCQDDSI